MVKVMANVNTLFGSFDNGAGDGLSHELEAAQVVVAQNVACAQAIGGLQVCTHIHI